MASKNIIMHEKGGVSIYQRDSDGFLNATKMCSDSGKKWSHYFSNAVTKNYLEAMAVNMGVSPESLVDAVRGGRIAQGTWIHPKVAIHLAQWLSPEFAVQVTNLVFDWMSGNSGDTLPATIPNRKILEAKLILIWSDQEVETTDLSDESLNYALSHVRPDAVVLSHKRVGDALDPAREGLAAGIHLWSEIGDMVQRRGVSA